MISSGRRQRRHGRLGPQRGSSDAGDLGGFPRPTGAPLFACGTYPDSRQIVIFSTSATRTPQPLRRRGPLTRPATRRHHHLPARSRNSRQSPFFLLLVIVAVVLGIIGVAAKGLLYLLFIGIVVFLGALIFAALRIRRRPGK